MKLIQIRELVQLLAHRAKQVQSYGYKIYERVEVVSAEQSQKRVELLLRLPPGSVPHDNFGRIQRTSLCGIMDAATSVTAWFANPRQLVSVSIDMNFSFVQDGVPDREFLLRAVCEDVMGKVAYTTGEVTQNGDLVLSAKHTVFFLDKTLKEAFRL